MNSNDKKGDPQKENSSEVIRPGERMGVCHSMEGSMQEALQRCAGRHVVVEFLVGTDSVITRSGILYEVGMSYIMLYDEAADAYTICDFYAIKFVTAIDPVKRPQRRR